MFYLALREMEKQFSMDEGILLERFRNGIGGLFENGKLSADKVNEGSTEKKENLVFYDGEYYYFTSEVLRCVGTELNLDRKALLLIQQELIDQRMVKQYRAAGSRRSELKVDIFVGELRGRRKVFAIKREFWDSVGGIALYERGD